MLGFDIEIFPVFLKKKTGLDLDFFRLHMTVCAQFYL